MAPANYCGDAAHRTIAWETFSKHGGFVVPWLDDDDYMYACAGGTGVSAAAAGGEAMGEGGADGSDGETPGLLRDADTEGSLPSTGGGAPAIQNRWIWI